MLTSAAFICAASYYVKTIFDEYKIYLKFIWNKNLL